MLKTEFNIKQITLYEDKCPKTYETAVHRYRTLVTVIFKFITIIIGVKGH